MHNPNNNAQSDNEHKTTDSSLIQKVTTSSMIKSHLYSTIFCFTASISSFNFGYFMTMFNVIDLKASKKHYYGNVIDSDLLIP